MKKRIGLLFLLPFILIGCNTGSNDSNTDSNTSSEEVKYNELYKSTSWDDVTSVIEVVAGKDNSTVVPSVSADRFEYYLTVDEQTSLDLAVVNCYGFNENVVITRYEAALEQNGFLLSSENPYGWKEVSITDDLVVQYSLVNPEDSPAYFELLIYKVATRIADWPEEALKTVTAENVPMIKGQSYEVFADFTIDNKARLIIYAYHPEIKNVQAYENQLISAGYTITPSQYYSEAVSKLGTHIMYDYNEEGDTFAIYVWNDWPYFDINSYLGMDLPRLEDNAFEYRYMNYEDGQQILIIYFDNVEQTVLDIYGKALENLGFEQYGDERSSSGKYTTISREYIINIDKEDEHDIVISYCVEQKSLAVAIYY